MLTHTPVNSKGNQESILYLCDYCSPDQLPQTTERIQTLYTSDHHFSWTGNCPPKHNQITPLPQNSLDFPQHHPHTQDNIQVSSCQRRHDFSESLLAKSLRSFQVGGSPGLPRCVCVCVYIYIYIYMPQQYYTLTYILHKSLYVRGATLKRLCLYTLPNGHFSIPPAVLIMMRFQ